MTMTRKERDYVEALEAKLAQSNALRFPSYPIPIPIAPHQYPVGYDQAIRLFTHIHDGRFEEHLVCSFGYKERDRNGVWVPEHGWRRHDMRRDYFTTLALARMHYRWQETARFGALLAQQDKLIAELQEDDAHE